MEALTKPSLDIAPIGGKPFTFPKATNGREILEMFDRNVAAVREAITQAKEEQMGQSWTLSHAGNPISAMPRSAVVRQVVLNHIIHHRAILCVYLRLKHIPVPGMYGPSGDE